MLTDKNFTRTLRCAEVVEEVQQAADGASASQPASRRSSLSFREPQLSRGHWLRPQLLFSSIHYDPSLNEHSTERQPPTERWLMRGRTLRSAADEQQLQRTQEAAADAAADWQQKLKQEGLPSASAMLASADGSPSKPGFFISR